MVLTERQKKDLNEAILDYLLSEGDTYKRTIESFRDEAKLSSVSDSGKGLLEKKWTAVVRLQKRVMDLEAQLISLPTRNTINNASSSSDSRLLPKAPPQSILTGHRGPVTSISIHPSYTMVCSSSEDATIKVWDYDTAQYERTLKGHTGPVTSISYDNTGNILASCSADMSAKLWDMATYTCTKTLKGHDHTLSSVQFMPNNDQLLTASRDNTIKVWEVNSGFCIKTFTGHTDWVKCMSISLDGTMLASGSSDQSIIIWRLPTGQIAQTLNGHEHVVECVSFGKKISDASSLVSAAGVSTVTALVEASTANSSSSGSSSKTLLANDEFNYLASGSRDRSVRLWNAFSGQCLMVFTVHDSWVRSVIFHPSGKYIISCSDDKSIRVLDIKENRCMRTISDAHTHFVTCLAMSAKNGVVISGSVDKNVAVWSCS